MNEMQIFEREDFGQMRTTTIDGEPWFVGKDVAEILGYAIPRKAIRDHVDDEDKGVLKWNTPGGPQDLTIINESGVYSLVFSSTLPAAKSFKRWVTSEILPTLRKTGSYSMRDTDARLKEAAQILASCRHPKAIPALVAVLNEYTGVEIKAPGPTYDESQFDDLVHIRNWIETMSLTIEDIVNNPTTVLYQQFTTWLNLNHLGVRISSKVFCAIMRDIYGFNKKLRQDRYGKWHFQM